MPPNPDAGIPDLIRRLADDSKRLMRDEVRLAKLEMHESVRGGMRGMLFLALAFGVGVVALVALTIFLSAGLGRLLGNYWAGTLVVAALELGGGFFLVKKGLSTMTSEPATFPESRAALRETAQWVKTAREPEVAGRPLEGRATPDAALRVPAASDRLERAD
jgi:uncharacterized membrane protein YqjE